MTEGSRSRIWFCLLQKYLKKENDYFLSMSRRQFDKVFWNVPADSSISNLFYNYIFCIFYNSIVNQFKLLFYWSNNFTETTSTSNNLRIPITLPKGTSTSEPSMTLETKFPSTTLPPTKMSEVLKITTKFQENKTTPQIYLRSIVTANKKLNVTTNIFAEGFSIEGLIVKTPNKTNNSRSHKLVMKIKYSFLIILKNKV